MREESGRDLLVLGRNRLIVDLVGQMLEPLQSSEGSSVAVLVDPAEEHWAQAAELGVPVVLVADELSDDLVIDAVLRGAAAVVPADDVPLGLHDAVVVVQNGGASLRPHHALAVVEAFRRKSTSERIHLTRREAQIIESIAGGDSVKQTAILLGITPKTVENLQGRLFRKLGVRNRAQAVARAHDLALFDGGEHPSGDGGIAP